MMVKFFKHGSFWMSICILLSISSSFLSVHLTNYFYEIFDQGSRCVMSYDIPIISISTFTFIFYFILDEASFKFKRVMKLIQIITLFTAIFSGFQYRMMDLENIFSRRNNNQTILESSSDFSLIDLYIDHINYLSNLSFSGYHRFFFMYLSLLCTITMIIFLIKSKISN